MCIGYSIVEYFHAQEVVTLFFIALFSLLCGTFAGVFLYIILDACWLRSYLEKEVKSELHSRYNNIISVSLIALCSLIAFFGCFGKVVEKTWDDMDIGVRNDEWTSTETPKKEKFQKKESLSEILPDENILYTMVLDKKPRPTPVTFGGVLGDTLPKPSAKRLSSQSYTPHHPLDDDSIISAHTRRKRAEVTTQAKTARDLAVVSERITDSDCDAAEGSEQEDFWITEEDDTTHNTTCDRYGEGEGMYSAVGSGTDCDECGGAR